MAGRKPCFCEKFSCDTILKWLKMLKWVWYYRIQFPLEMEGRMALKHCRSLCHLHALWCKLLAYCVCHSIIRFPQFGAHKLNQFRIDWCRCCHLREAALLCAPPFREAQHSCLHTAVNGERKVCTYAGQMFYARIKMQLEVSEQSSQAVHPHCHNQPEHCKTPKWQIDPQIW